MDTSHDYVNGVDITDLGEKARMFQNQPNQARFQFQLTNSWKGAGHSTSRISAFHGAEQRIPHEREFRIEADEPEILEGSDRAPNPVEHLLNALVSCLTTSMVYHAAARGVKIRSVESSAEGELDVRGFMGLSDQVRKGYERVRVAFQVDSDAPVELLRECAMYSPVYDVVSRGTEVELAIEKV